MAGSPGDEDIDGPSSSGRRRRGAGDDSRTHQALLSTGDRIGVNIEVQGFLAAGGMSKVFRAHHAGFDRPIALKVPPEEVCESEDASKLLLKEARRLAKLKHPSIAEVLDCGRVADWSPAPLTYVSMELLEGPTLAGHLGDHGPLSLAEAIAILRPLAEALDHAHQQGFVHRDIKPGNVMFTADPAEGGRPKLIDFGLAGKTEDAASRSGVTISSQEGGSAGTPPYMSPEQIRAGRPRPSMDVWGLAVVAYEMLTDALPFPSRTLRQQQILEQQPDPLSPSDNPDLDEAQAKAVTEVLLWGMEKDPADRPASPLDLVEALSRVAAGDPSPGRADPPVPVRQAELPEPVAAEAEDAATGPSEHPDQAPRRAPGSTLRRFLTWTTVCAIGALSADHLLQPGWVLPSARGREAAPVASPAARKPDPAAGPSAPPASTNRPAPPPASSAGPPQDSEDPVLVQIGSDEVLRVSDLRRIRAQNPRVAKLPLRRALEDLVRFRRMARAAREAGFPERDPAVVSRIRNRTRAFRHEYMVRQALRTLPPVPNEGQQAQDEEASEAARRNQVIDDLVARARKTWPLTVERADPDDAQDAGDLLATIGTMHLTRADFDSAWRDASPAVVPSYQGPGGRQRFLARLIEQTLISNLAQNDPEFLANQEPTIRDVRRQLLINAYTEAELYPEVEVEDGAVREYYDANRSRFRTPPDKSLRARHLLVRVTQDADSTAVAAARSKVDAALARIRAGEDFSRVARDISEGPTGPRGGDLGAFGPGAMVPSFDAAVQGLEDWQVTHHPVRTRFGFHLIRREPVAKFLSFDESRQTIEQELTAKARNDVIKARLSELEAARPATFFDDRFEPGELLELVDGAAEVPTG